VTAPDAAYVGAGLGALVGLGAGLATPMLAGRFGVRAGRWRWVFVGVATGAALGWRLAPAAAPVLCAWLVLLAAGLPLTAIDLGVHRLPDVLVLPAGVAVAALAAIAGDGRALLAGLALVAAYAVVAILPRSALGFGDVKLAGVPGTALGLLGWGALLWATALAFALGGAVALWLLLTRRAHRDTPLAFGPYLLAGAVLAALAG
jgi:leader peptidase (prepilin peptidase) / N-methyltransferase